MSLPAEDEGAVRAILSFWFGDGPDSEWPDKRDLWFGGKEEDDRAIRERFGDTVERALRGECDHWRNDADGLCAYVVCLDQFTRAGWRGTAKAFAGDSLALAAALDAIRSGADIALPAIRRVFLYLPLEHAEDMESQELSVQKFEAMHKERPEHVPLKEAFRYAVAHRDIIRQFGRFPHRNRVLGRESSAEESEYMRSGGATFGQ